MKFIPSFLVISFMSCPGMGIESDVLDPDITIAQNVIAYDYEWPVHHVIKEEEVYGYNLNKVIARFRSDYDVEEKEARLVELQLKEFLINYARKQRYIRLANQRCEQLWNTFTLHTREYYLFCFRCFGRMIHHEPSRYYSSKPEVNTLEEMGLNPLIARAYGIPRS
jgi:hypothetical protein